MGDTLICVICNKSSDKIRLFSDETLKKFELILKLRKKHNLKYNDIILLREFKEGGYHRECYKSFTGLMKKYYTSEPKKYEKTVKTEQEKETSNDVNTSTDDSIPGSSHLAELTVSYLPSASQSTEPQPSQVAMDVSKLEEVSEIANATTKVNSSFQSVTRVDMNKNICFFCNKKKKQVRSKMLSLHEGDKNRFQSRIMSSIENQEDEYNELLSKLESIAGPKIYYHTACRVQFNNKISSTAKISVKSDWHHHRDYHQETFNEISSIIEEDIINNGRCHSLIHLHELYTDSLERIYAENSIEMDATFTAHHLEEKIHKKFSKDIKFFTIQNKKIIAPNYIKTIDETVLDNLYLKSESILQKAALILRRTILTMNKKKIPSKNLSVQHLIADEASIPQELYAFYSILIGGSRWKRKSSLKYVHQVRSYCQDIIYGIHNGQVNDQLPNFVRDPLKTVSETDDEEEAHDIEWSNEGDEENDNIGDDNDNE